MSVVVPLERPFSSPSTLEALARSRVMAIVRRDVPDGLLATAHALVAGGIEVLEVTLDTPGALAALPSWRGALPEHVRVGAGTVLTSEDARAAVDAGAQFLVSPVVDEAVLRIGSEAGIEVFPGAMTPTEILRAWESGAAAVKLFPVAAMGGPDYVKALRGPFPDVPLIAVGGVGMHDLPHYLAAGCLAVGLGGSLVDPGAEGWSAPGLAERARMAVQAATAEP